MIDTYGVYCAVESLLIELGVTEELASDAATAAERAVESVLYEAGE